MLKPKDKGLMMFHLKAENRETELYALSDFKGIESFDDIRDAYLAGSYGAIPNLAEMKKEEEF